MHTLIKTIENKYKKEQGSKPRFAIGDTVKVHTKIVEGNKERVQIYTGIVVARKGSGLSETFTVNRVAFGYANEKIFPVYSPNIVQVEVIQHGKIRRAKLNHIRGKIGKKAKIAAQIKRNVADRFHEEPAREDDIVQDEQTPPSEE